MTSSAILHKKLAILEPYLKKRGLIELSINRPGEVWLETASGWQVINDSNLTLSALMSLAKLLATESGQDFDEITPLLSLNLPKYDYRTQVVASYAADSAFCLSIRVSYTQDVKIEQYGFYNNLEKTSKKLKKINNSTEQLLNLISNKSNILISGGTSSGKTTLLNALIKKIDKKERIITIEDTKELIVCQKNNVRLIKSKTGTDVAKISYEDLINASLRLRPDRILLGEIDIENTTRFLRILNTGHSGSLATIHANSPIDAIDALVMNAKLSGFKGNDDTIRKYAINYLDAIIQIKKTADRKFIINIQEVE